MYTYAISFYAFLINVSIIGASGYSGAELVRLLSARSDITIRKLTAAKSVGRRVDELYPAFAGSLDLAYESFDVSGLSGSDIVFVALPSGEAMKVVPPLLDEVGRIVDLGGDFRLASPDKYEEYYRRPHEAKEYLGRAVYGLPELFRNDIANASFVANPGCYATSILLALLPALRHGAILPESIVINSLSGVSGAGRSTSEELSFAEVNENVRAYKVTNHQHVPEIESILRRVSDSNVSISFVPHLMPLTRGIYTTIHAKLTQPSNENGLFDLYEEFYATTPFVRICRQIPQIKNVVFTNYCDLWFTIEKRTNQLVIISVIDNLVKGAAGQAIQNMNLMFGLPETSGLL